MNNQIKTIYQKLFDSLISSKYKGKDKKLCLFNAQVGNQYDKKLMIVGRAVNGWSNEFTINNINNTELLSALDTPKTSECPLKWIINTSNEDEGYNSNRSAFWRIAKKTAFHLNPKLSNDSWTSSIVWSNLYKIAPSAGGNPSDSLCDLQFQYCNKILQLEIELYKPKYILFLTGINWFNGYLEEKNSFENSLEYKYIDATGTYLSSKIIIAKHPQGKPEDIFISELSRAFSTV